MKRLTMLLAVVSLLAALLAVPVYAAEESYQFEMLPSVSLLPEFDPNPDAMHSMMLDGILPEGQYTAVMYFSIYSALCTLRDTVTVSYSFVEDYGSYPVCIIESSFVLLDEVVPCQITFISAEEEGCTIASITFDGAEHTFQESDFLILEPVEVTIESEDSALKSVITELFGPYEQQTETITEILADGSTVTYEQRIPGIAGLDYEWFASVGLFALVLLSFFRLLGGLIKQ